MSQQSTKAQPQLHKLPAQPSSFIGRDSEVARITELLADPDCRLLTLVGPGGIGKTRLAIQVISELSAEFDHGVYFVPLHSIDSTGILASTVADAINLSLRGQDDPFVQLLTCLADKEMLLVLDNFEHLLPPADTSAETYSVAVLTGILESAPAVKLLITSREALNLQGEWLLPVQGLPFPKHERADDIDAYGAVQLFVERARQVRPDFSLAQERAEVIRICQLVEGMPLALEIAASWAKMLRCEEIAREIEENLQFLASRLRDVPERHRSLQAIFDQSWELLTESERDAFKRLSVFRGGFGQTAAKEIAGATLPILSALIDKSLLRWEPEKRYSMHGLLRQFAAEQLVQSPEDVAQVYDLHCAYYADFLQQREADMTSTNQGEAIQQIAVELENVRAAWQWAVSQERVNDIQKAANTYYMFCDMRGRFREVTADFAQAITCLNEMTPNRQTELTLALLHVLQGWNDIRIGSYDEAKRNFERGQHLYEQLNVPSLPSFGAEPKAGLALLAHILGNYSEAVELGRESYRQNKAQNDRLNLQIALYAIGNAMMARGDYEAAKSHFQEAYSLTKETGDRWMMGYILSQLGNVARALGNYDEARHHYQASYDLKQALDDPEGMAVALNHLGKLALQQGEAAQARDCYERSHAIYRGLSDKGGLATALCGLGQTALTSGENRRARTSFGQALQLATEIRFVPLICAILVGLGELLVETDQMARGLELLAFAQHHSACEHETQERARDLLSRYESQTSSDLFVSANERGHSSDLETMLITLQLELSTPPSPSLELEDETSAAQESPSPQPATQPLAEPLTPRELEVLRLIAQGWTNQEIAHELFIVVGTVKAHASNIYGKLNVNNRTEAVAKAKELDLL